MNASNNENILVLKGVSKEFPGVKALDNVNLAVRRGEVLALAGENGAGKSTLMKILSGSYTRDSGTIEFCGQQVDIQQPRDAEKLGLSIIYQELNILQGLTVAENIFLGQKRTDKLEENEPSCRNAVPAAEYPPGCAPKGFGDEYR